MLNRLTITTALCAFTFTIANGAQADSNHKDSMPNYHAPISVMGDHTHAVGEVMISYRHARMGMKGMKDGDNNVTPSAVVQAGGNYGYMMTPTRMTMDMDMLGVMYAPNSDVTFMAMGHYMQKDMRMLMRNGMTPKMETEGFGDTVISALYKLEDEQCDCGTNNVLHANIGLSLPTGSIDEKAVRMGSYGNLPYAMQLGSGTFDPIFGLTYNSYDENISWGGQIKTTLRLGKNEEGYRLGSEYSVGSWISKNFTDWLSGSIKLDATHKEDINGQDQGISGLVGVTPTADPNNYGGQTINLGLGINLYNPDGALKGHRLALEYTKPIYENLNGVQMSTDNVIWLGWQYAF